MSGCGVTVVTPPALLRVQIQPQAAPIAVVISRLCISVADGESPHTAGLSFSDSRNSQYIALIFEDI